MPAPPSPPGKYAPLQIFLAAALWATDAPFRWHLSRELPSRFIVLAEHLVDTLLVLPVLLLHRRQLRNLSWRGWGAVSGIAVGGSALANLAFTQAFRYVTPSVAIMLQKLQPLLAIALAAWWLGERLSRRFFGWAALALLGAYAISFPTLRPRLFDTGHLSPNASGVALALLAAALWAIATVLGRWVLREVDFKVMTSLRFVIAFVFLFLWNGGPAGFLPSAQFTPTDALCILAMAVTSGVISLFIYYRGLSHTKASIATLAELSFPMATVLVNAVFLRERLRPAQFVGLLLLLLAVYKLTHLNRSEEGPPALPPAAPEHRGP